MQENDLNNPVNLSALLEKKYCEVVLYAKLLSETVRLKGELMKRIKRDDLELWLALSEECHVAGYDILKITNISLELLTNSEKLSSTQEQDLLCSLHILISLIGIHEVKLYRTTMVSTPVSNVRVRYVDRLSCIFSRLVNEISDIGGLLNSGHMPFLSTFIDILTPSFQWICDKLDVLEAQLRNDIHSVEPVEAAIGFSMQLLSFMKRENILDVPSCRHLAYILDAFMYFLARKETFIVSKHHYPGRFFDRSESIQHEGIREGPSFEETSSEAFPLVVHPDYLSTAYSFPVTLHAPVVVSLEHPKLCSTTPHELIARWHKSIDIFVSTFLIDVGTERNSFLKHRTTFQARDKIFRKKMDLQKEKEVQVIEMKIGGEISVEIFGDTIIQLNKIYKDAVQRHGTEVRQPLNSREIVKVTFKGKKHGDGEQQGEGTGVFRNYLGHLKTVLLDPGLKLPVPLCVFGTDGPCASNEEALRLSGGDFLFSMSDLDQTCLFWEKREFKLEFLSLFQGCVSAYRMNCFRNIGFFFFQLTFFFYSFANFSKLVYRAHCWSFFITWRAFSYPI